MIKAQQKIQTALFELIKKSLEEYTSTSDYWKLLMSLMKTDSQYDESRFNQSYNHPTDKEKNQYAQQMISKYSRQVLDMKEIIVNTLPNLVPIIQETFGHTTFSIEDFLKATINHLCSSDDYVISVDESYVELTTVFKISFVKPICDSSLRLMTELEQQYSNEMLMRTWIHTDLQEQSHNISVWNHVTLICTIL